MMCRRGVGPWRFQSTYEAVRTTGRKFGGGVLWYQISGTQTLPQLLRLQANGGGALGSTVRLAITRVQ